jgi:hypothetical protein
VRSTEADSLDPADLTIVPASEATWADLAAISEVSSPSVRRAVIRVDFDAQNAQNAQNAQKTT